MKCPKCGKDILDRGAIVCCTDHRKTGVMCSFSIKRDHLCRMGRGLFTDDELKELIRGNEIELNLVNRNGIPFDCFGYLEESEKGWIKFRFLNNNGYQWINHTRYSGVLSGPVNIFYEGEE